MSEPLPADAKVRYDAEARTHWIIVDEYERVCRERDEWRLRALQAEMAAKTWHRLVQAIATILEVDGNGSAEEVGAAIAEKIRAPLPPSVPLWLAQALEQRAQHEPNCSWSREACVCSCGLFELRMHLANILTDANAPALTKFPSCDCRRQNTRRASFRRVPRSGREIR